MFIRVFQTKSYYKHKSNKLHFIYKNFKVYYGRLVFMDCTENVIGYQKQNLFLLVKIGTTGIGTKVSDDDY